jgi:hypothetical protein
MEISGQSHGPDALTTRKAPRVPILYETGGGGFKGQSGRYGEYNVS